VHSWVRFLSAMIFAILAISVFAANGTALPSCSDVATADFANIIINVHEEGPVSLKNGKGYTPHIVVNGKDLGSEWEVTIEKNLLLRPAPGVALRLIDLNLTKLLGSGGWGYALIYECKDGKLQRVFKSAQHLYGVKLNKIDERTFTIVYGVWAKTDPTSTPSMVATDTYAWFASEGAFKRIESVKAPHHYE
jgi:hypothetical protein